MREATEQALRELGCIAREKGAREREGEEESSAYIVCQNGVRRRPEAAKDMRCLKCLQSGSVWFRAALEGENLKGNFARLYPKLSGCVAFNCFHRSGYIYEIVRFELYCCSLLHDVDHCWRKLLASFIMLTIHAMLVGFGNKCCKNVFFGF